MEKILNQEEIDLLFRAAEKALRVPELPLQNDCRVLILHRSARSTGKRSVRCRAAREPRAECQQFSGCRFGTRENNKVCSDKCL